METSKAPQINIISHPDQRNKDPRTLASSPIDPSRLDGESSSDRDRTPSPNRRPRCGMDNCKKRLGLVPFECRCSVSFCDTHRLDDFQKHLAKNSVTVAPQKLAQF